MENTRVCRACTAHVAEYFPIEENGQIPELPLLLKLYIPEFVSVDGRNCDFNSMFAVFLGYKSG